MNTIWKDLTSPLDKVQRPWIRRPVLLVLMPFFMALLIVAGILDGLGLAAKETVNLFQECW